MAYSPGGNGCGSRLGSCRGMDYSWVKGTPALGVRPGVNSLPLLGSTSQAWGTLRPSLNLLIPRCSSLATPIRSIASRPLSERLRQVLPQLARRQRVRRSHPIRASQRCCDSGISKPLTDRHCQGRCLAMPINTEPGRS